MSVDRLRRLGAHPRLEPAVALVLRGRQVRETGRFVAREAAGRRGAAVYRLRSSGLRVVVRHGTGDVVTLGEIFHRPDYAPQTVVAAALGTPRRILDLGANVGMFGLWALGRWPGAEVTGYEPDPFNAAIHERAIAVNGLDARWRLVRAAAGARDGTVRFASGQAALSHVVADGEGDTEVPLRDVLAEIAQADLVKLDVEGGEWEVLGDERFAAAPPRAIVFEYHPRGCPGDDPHAEALRLLACAGLRSAEVWSRADGHGMLWGWR
jgi:FkbM family methyltransferase